MKKSWSLQLAAEFEITLSEDLKAWYDQELWKESAPAEFVLPIAPEQVLDVDSSTIWGGQMLPDTLPILANGMGDVIAVRFDAAGAVRELLRWNHEGCTWTPYGQSLCEALVFDTVVSRLSGEYDADIHDGESLFVKWALEQIDLCPDRREQLGKALDSDNIRIEDLITCGVAEIPGRKVLAEACLATPLVKAAQETGGMALAESLGVDWSELSAGLYDSQLIPQEHRDKLAGLLEISVDQLLFQDWPAASAQGARVVAKRTDLAWPYAVLGRAAEHEGCSETALGHYLSGISAMGTTSDFTEAWSEPAACPSKYCAQRLLTMADQLPQDSADSAYIRAATSRDLYSISEYWRSEAGSAEDSGAADRAYDCWYHAGWDEYAFDDMQAVLDGLVRTAKAAGYTALYKLAEHHKRTLA